jgi:hypothetical protein
MDVAMKNLIKISAPESEPVSHPGMFEVYKIRNTVGLSCLDTPDGPGENSNIKKEAVKPPADRPSEMIAYFIRAGY